MILSSIFILIAAFCAASVHVLSHDFNGSIYGRFSRNIIEEMWWNGQFSWKNLYKGHAKVYGRAQIKILFFKVNKPAFLCHATGLFNLISHISIAAAIVLYTPKYGVFIDFFIALTIMAFSYLIFKRVITK
jgi:hypothetical protein